MAGCSWTGAYKFGTASSQPGEVVASRDARVHGALLSGKPPAGFGCVCRTPYEAMERPGVCV